jgi:transposase
MRIKRISNSKRGKRYYNVNKCILILDEGIKEIWNYHDSILYYINGEKIVPDQFNSYELKNNVLVAVKINKDHTGFGGVYVEDGVLTV